MNMKKNNRMTPACFWTLTALSVLPTFAVAQELGDVNAQRERWALHARSGQIELSESVEALRQLYAQTADVKVRTDLIALLVRQGKGNEALAVCSTCAPNDYSANELENLAKAARDNQKFTESVALYDAMQTQSPQKKIGWLGGALAAVDAKEYTRSESLIAAYRKQFGNDADIEMAEGYLKDRSQTAAERIIALQDKLASNPNDQETVLRLYRTASELQAFPLQQDLADRYPQWFTENDRRGLKKAEAVVVLRSGKIHESKSQIQVAYDTLSKIVDETDSQQDIHIQALRDRMAAALALGQGKQALKDYDALKAISSEQPAYVQEQYAQALAMQGHSLKALKLHEEVARKQLVKDGVISPDVHERLIQDYADVGRFDEAQRHLDSLNTSPQRRDFTRTVVLNNPQFDKEYFWQVRLKAWDGDIKGATKLIDNWLLKHPGDSWAIAMRGELASWDNKSDEAQVLYEQAKVGLHKSNHGSINANQGNLMLDNGNWAGASELLAGIDQNNLAYQGFLKRYDESRAAQLSISGSMFKATSPKDSGNEWAQNATLYSPRSAKGHRAYVREQTGHVPNHGNELNHGSIGVGTELSFYPFNVNVEAGKGLKLNDKAYLNAGVAYRLNQAWSFNARASINSPNTPVKAMAQDVYANEYSIGANYVPSSKTRIGLGFNVGDYDDGNVRQGVYAWLSQNLYQHSRWKLDGSLWTDYNRNKEIATAAYYNPRRSNSTSGDLDLSYWLPLNNNTKLTQHWVGSVGRFWQADHKAENTWMVKYRHEWSLGKQLGVSYDVGRKKAIYDGNPEFHNFANVSLNFRFK